MTMPELPRQEYPDIERLRAALANYDKSRGIFPSVTTTVIEAARSLIATFDAQVAAQEAAARQAASTATHGVLSGCACGGQRPVAGWWHSPARCYATGGSVSQ